MTASKPIAGPAVGWELRVRPALPWSSAWNSPKHRAEKIRIFFFVSRLDLAGTERQAVEIAARLDPAKFDVYFGSFFETGPLAERIRQISKFHIRLRLTGMVGPSFALSVIRLARFLQRNQIQVVQCFDFYTNIVGALAGRIARIPLVVTSRRHIGNTLSHRQVWLETRAFRLSHWVITNCRAAANVLTTAGLVGNERVRTIYNGIDLTNYCDAPDPLRRLRPAVGMLANLRPAKDHACFLQAAAKVARVHPNVRFVLVGARTQNDQVRDACQKLGISGRVDLMGEQPPPRIPQILGSFAVSVLSSHGEGFPNAVLESMAAGVPVIATAVGGCHELIVDGATGFLVPPGNAETLSERISFLLRNPDIAEGMGQAGRLRVMQMNDFTGVMQQWTDFYIEELRSKCVHIR